LCVFVCVFQEMTDDSSKDLHNTGERCHIQKHRGTVRYVGPVPPTDGLWYGVEWDTDRGKNDGMVHGKRYFQCKNMHGSFVRPAKLSFGVDAVTGFRNTYGNGQLNFDDKGIVLHEKTNHETVIDLVGFDKVALKQSDYESLKDADLSCANISHGGEDLQQNLEKVAPYLKSLNLRDNLFSTLTDVCLVAGGLTRLQNLNISGNRITDWKDLLSKDMFIFPVLNSIYINKMQINWNHVIIIAKTAPNLREIHACINEIQEIYHDPCLEKIETLNIQGNSISNWNHVLALSRLKNLKKLILNNNQLAEVLLPVNNGEVLFANLKSLSLCENLIAEWNSVNIMSKLPSLTELRFRDNPVTQGKTGFELRQELIARLSSIKILNGSEVAERERKTAEMAYIKLYSNDYYSSHRTNLYGQFIQDHPRYEQLANVHGLPEEEVHKTKSLKDNLVSLEFKCPECSSKPVTQKRVPATMTLQQLKGVLQRLYKVPTSKQKISYLDSKNNREIDLEDNMKQLNFYSITSGDVILLRW